MKINHLIAKDLCAQKGERLLFEDIGFTVNAGEALLLKGPNGSGKTTLLHILAGAERPQKGSINFKLGANATVREDGVLGASHFITHQDSLKKNLTVLENLTFWTQYMGGDVSRIKNALQTVGLEPMPHILAVRLSAGQKKRLMLARLLTISHPLWLMDEPSVSLDDNGQALLVKLMQEHLSAGGILIASSHIDLGINFSQTLTLSGGRYTFNDDYLFDQNSQSLSDNATHSKPFGDTP